MKSVGSGDKQTPTLGDRKRRDFENNVALERGLFMYSFYVIYQTQRRVFHSISKHRECLINSV